MEHEYDMDDPIEFDIAEQSVIKMEDVLSDAIRSQMGEEFGEYDARIVISAMVCLMADIALQAEVDKDVLISLLDIAMEDDDE
jgi:hypothetical protein